ncbi:tetraacyldisaccharide 4'-kinase [Hymenobacter chitinivorans]|uniref:Tetraacyldisaccharide 4'-kinase n=1 Tax=Hymenobacter chitinivorans DSM 11115 TaxID=1121954 RepID=A0A2M9BRN3_9BACT|nr:tetraacyldisaccharide 4'-kinase [Hymenobacter chitinivorans]PJJ60619.1 tetraacyldisaccharide 4'-kinase [Hymenobacter chitinivorans DSM 11115]
MPHPLALLLLPFAWLYAAVLGVRNWLYDKGIKNSARFARPTISVGNLRAGGTGKTPHVAWLVRQLQAAGQQPAILSRGYGRRTRGYLEADATATAATIGDEPLQHYQDFQGQVPVVVCENRRMGLETLLQREPAPTAVVLDDAYQHRRVQPTLNILLTEQHRPFYQDYVLPAGRLRESRGGARRADAVVVTKCDSGLTASQQAAITDRVRRYSRPRVPVLFSTYCYGAPVAVGGAERVESPEIVLLTGIAQPGPLLEYLTGAGYHIVQHAAFADHHPFTLPDIAALAGQLRAGQSVFTTQKDAVRLLEPALQAAVAALPIFYIPIQVEFLADGAAQLQQLLSSLFQPHAVV